MKDIKNKKKIFIWSLLSILVVVDQITKIIVRQTINYNERISVIKNFITLTKIENTGAFLGLGNNLPTIVYIIIMVIIPLIVLGYILFYVLTNKNLSKLLILGITLIIGGGIGNIIDRILFRSVTDFLHFNFGIFQTGIVNVADMSVTTGFFILLYEIYINKRSIFPKSKK